MFEVKPTLFLSVARSHCPSFPSYLEEGIQDSSLLFLLTFTTLLTRRRNLSGLKENSVARNEDQESNWKRLWNHRGFGVTCSPYLYCQ